MTSKFSNLHSNQLYQSHFIVLQYQCFCEAKVLFIKHLIGIQVIIGHKAVFKVKTFVFIF